MTPARRAQIARWQAAGAKSRKPRGTPYGKSSIPLIEVTPGGPRASKQLQKRLKADGAHSLVHDSFNYHNGGWKGTTRNVVAYDTRGGKKKPIGAMVLDVNKIRGKHYSNEVHVGQLFKEPGSRKGTGKHLLAYGARVSKLLDKKAAPSEFKAYSTVHGARKFYKSAGAHMVSWSSTADWTPGLKNRARRNRLAKTRIRVKVVS
jgi:hypothetical protein